MLSYKQPSPWVVHAAGLTDTGQVRENNEDNLLVDKERGLFIVSDGMGGHQAGEVASQAVVTVLPPMIEQLAARIEEPSKEAVETVLRDAILQLSQRLRDESKGKAGLQGMGATVAVVWLLGTKAHLACMGDSRIYLFRDNSLTQLTQDHSVVALLLRHKEITQEEAREHPARGRLSRYVGMEGDTFSDLYTFTMQPSDRLLLCSDGLTGMVPDEAIKKVLMEYPDPQKACEVLVAMANEHGGKDNITALVINVSEHYNHRKPTELNAPKRQRTIEPSRMTERPKVLEQPRLAEGRRKAIVPKRPRPSQQQQSAADEHERPEKKRRHQP